VVQKDGANPRDQSRRTRGLRLKPLDHLCDSSAQAHVQQTGRENKELRYRRWHSGEYDRRRGRGTCERNGRTCFEGRSFTVDSITRASVVASTRSSSAASPVCRACVRQRKVVLTEIDMQRYVMTRHKVR
jgi:hypothetical protein